MVEAAREKKGAVGQMQQSCGNAQQQWKKKQLEPRHQSAAVTAGRSNDQLSSITATILKLLSKSENCAFSMMREQPKRQQRRTASGPAVLGLNNNICSDFRM